MATKLLCVILDRMAQAIGPVMVFPALGAAVRTFGDVANDPQTMVSRHPEDFDVLQVANIDDATGVVTPLVPPAVLLTGAAWVAAQSREAKPSAEDGGQLSLLKKEA